MGKSVGRFAVVLGLDVSAAAAVRELRLQLGLPRVSDSSTETEVLPHVTLASCSGLDLELFRPFAAEIAAASGPLPCTLASIGLFPTAEGVLFLAPAISADLVQMQLAVFERLRQIGAAIEPYWTPGQWVPHCTLAIGVPPETIANALRQAMAEFQPIAGQLVRLSVFAVTLRRCAMSFSSGRGESREFELRAR